MRNIILICISLILTCPCLARTITVDDDGPADFNNIQAAINDANDGDTVLVKDGTYTGDGNRDIDFLGKAITVRSQHGPENCIIDCNGSGGVGFCFESGEGANSVLDGFTITRGRSYDGGGIYCEESSPTIINCDITGNSGRYVGGINCERSSPTIINCNITKNNEGGIRCDKSSLTITNCNITDHVISPLSETANGIVCIESNCLIVNSVIAENQGIGIFFENTPGIGCTEASLKIINCNISENNNGGIHYENFCQRGGITIDRCRISGNEKFFGEYFCCGQGGGVYIGGSNALIINTIVSGNIVKSIEPHYPAFGGGIFSTNCGDNFTIRNCAITANKASAGGGIYFMYDSAPTITNSIVWGNEALNGPQIYDGEEPYNYIDIGYTDIEGGWEGIGNVDADPCFVMPGYWADINDPNIIVEPDDPNAVWLDGDYHLLPNSPCIDTGDPNYVSEPNETDLDGNPRIANGRVDMGAYEYIPPVEVEVKLTPQMLSCDSEGKWIKAHITLPEGYYPEDIDVNTPATAVPPGVESEFIEVFEKGKGNFDVQIYFGRKSFCDALSESEDGLLEVTVTGSLLDGRKFQGADTIKLKTPPRHHRIRQNRRYQNRRLFDGRRK